MKFPDKQGEQHRGMMGYMGLGSEDPGIPGCNHNEQQFQSPNRRDQHHTTGATTAKVVSSKHCNFI